MTTVRYIVNVLIYKYTSQTYVRNAEKKCVGPVGPEKPVSHGGTRASIWTSRVPELYNSPLGLLGLKNRFPMEEPSPRLFSSHPRGHPSLPPPLSSQAPLGLLGLKNRFPMGAPLSPSFSQLPSSVGPVGPEKPVSHGGTSLSLLLSATKLRWACWA